ncbi:MAG: M20/M25/M40 family metallo-hydrolase [Proteobacteria bacterium]|nr:M20/M25/M40 family metallo-hydrolase [Pseudomonadota bacterium]
MLERVVNINSGTMNFPGVRQVGDVFSAELDALGFRTAWVDGEAFNRAGHLVASSGNRGRRLLLIGHLDTVFEPDSKFQHYEVVDERYALGPGITDMKGGDVVMIHALRALKEAGVLGEMQIKIVMTGDEESRGRPHSIANKALIDAAAWADYAIGFEDGDGDPTTAVVSRRGSSGWQLRVSGKPAHSSQIFQESMGYGAVFEAARILDQFRIALSDVPNLTFNPALIIGGTDVEHDVDGSRGSAFGKKNVIAQTVTVSGDIRALSPQQLEMAQLKMQQIVSKNLAHTSAQLTFDIGYPPMAPSPGNEKILQLYNQVSEDLGYGAVAAVDPRRAGAADISFAAGFVDMAIDGLGLMGKGGHTVNEVADLHTLPQQTKRAALLFYRLNSFAATGVIND